MAGLIGLGQVQRGRAANTISKSAGMEFQRNQGNIAMDAARKAQEQQTLGMGAGMGAYYGVQQAGANVVKSTLGSTVAPSAVSTSVAGAAGGASAGATGATAGSAAAGSGAMATAASAIPYVAAGIAVAALFNKLFD